MAIPVVGGSRNSVTLAPSRTAPLTVPALLKDRPAAAAADAVTAKITLPDHLAAPISAGDVLGKISYSVGDAVLEEVPLVAMRDVAEGNGFKRLVDKLAVKFL